jgi:hypothetical protein
MTPPERPRRPERKTPTAWSAGGRPPAPPLPEDDPLAGAFPLKRNLPAFLFSTAFHALLLVLLATFSFAVVQREERITVKLREPAQALDESDAEGMPSLRDLAGVLRPQLVRSAPTGSVAGPSTGPAVAAVRAPDMPRIAGVGPSIGQSPGTLDIPLSIGGGGLAGPGGGGFGDVVSSLRKVGIDLVLVIDTTGSMQSVIEDVKKEVRAFIGNLQATVPASRVAVVAYRDKGEEYVTKWVDFSFKTEKVQGFVAGLRADGGGDYEEGVKQGIEAAIDELSWRKTAKRILILIGGTPPHRADTAALLQLARDFRAKGGSIGAIDVTKRLHEEYERADWVAHGSQGTFTTTPMPGFYRETTDAYATLSDEGGGELLSLGEEKALLKQVMMLTFGTRWRVEMARFMDRLQ